MLRIFEAIKKSPFFNANSITHTIPENASAEILANAQLMIDYFIKISTAMQNRSNDCFEQKKSCPTHYRSDNSTMKNVS